MDTESLSEAQLWTLLCEIEEELENCYVGLVMPPHPWLDKLRDTLERFRGTRQALKEKGAL